jgi:hypothetical protein
MQQVLEYANAFEPIQDGRIYTEIINGPFLFEAKGSPDEYWAGLQLAIESRPIPAAWPHAPFRDQNLCLKRNSRPKQVDDHPKDQFAQI